MSTQSSSSGELRPLRKRPREEAWTPTPQPNISSLGGVFHNFKSAHAGAEDHTRYITRADATEGRREALVLHNHPDWVEREGAGYAEVRERVCEYNRQREEDERRRGGGESKEQVRTHYKLKLSFEGKVETEHAARLTREYLREQFPHAAAVAAVHQNTAHTHVHVHIQARDLRGRKLQFGREDYRRLDEAWARIYGREFGEEKTGEHLFKKQEMREAKRRYREGLERCEREGRDKEEFKRDFRWPERAPKLQRDRIREQERRAYGAVRRNAEAPAREAREQSDMHYVRVNRERPCPVCHKSDGCSVSSDGARANCVRVVSSRAGGIGYWHDLKDRPTWLTQEVVETSKVTSEAAAPVEHRDRVYRAMLAMLKLHPQDVEDIEKRGLGERATTENQYRTVPSKQRAQEIAAELSKQFDLRGVPGFYKDANDGEWRLNVSRWHRGFFVPVTDEQGRIEGFQIRRLEPRTFVNLETNEVEKEPKYVWLSSTGTPDKPRPEGSSPGAPAHFHNVAQMRESGYAIITEGSLKGGVISHYLDQGVIAVAGVGTFSDELGKQLREQLPEIKKVSIAFDADYAHNAKVQHQMERLERVLSEAGFEVLHARWPEQIGKGLDDYCKERLGERFHEARGAERAKAQGQILRDVHSPNQEAVDHTRKLVEEDRSREEARIGRDQRRVEFGETAARTAGPSAAGSSAPELDGERTTPLASDALTRAALAADRAAGTVDRTARAARKLGTDGAQVADRARRSERGFRVQYDHPERSPFDVDF